MGSKRIGAPNKKTNALLTFQLKTNQNIGQLEACDCGFDFTSV